MSNEQVNVVVTGTGAIPPQQVLESQLNGRIYGMRVRVTALAAPTPAVLEAVGLQGIERVELFPDRRQVLVLENDHELPIDVCL